MSQKLQAVMPYLFLVEGGLVDNPNDPGGRTNLGITQATYDKFREKHHLIPQDVARITTQAAITIYNNEYWHPNRCEEMPWPAYLLHFDGCVNHRQADANIILQRALGVEDDGRIGPRTMAAVLATKFNPNFSWRYIWERQLFYSRIVKNRPSQGEFSWIWTWRLDKLLQRTAEGPNG